MPSMTAMHSGIHEYRLYGGTGSGCNNTSENPLFAGRKLSVESVFQGDQSCDGSHWAYHARRFTREIFSREIKK